MHVKKVAQPTLNFKMKLVAANNDDIEFLYIWKSDIEKMCKAETPETVKNLEDIIGYFEPLLAELPKFVINFEIDPKFKENIITSFEIA